MTDKLEKQKQLLSNYLSQVKYLQENGINALKFICYPCDDFEKTLKECEEVFSSDTMPPKNDLIDAKNNFEETRDLMTYLYVVNLLKDNLKVNMDYFTTTSAEINRQKANEKIGKALEKKKRGFCD